MVYRFTTRFVTLTLCIIVLESLKSMELNVYSWWVQGGPFQSPQEGAPEKCLLTLLDGRGGVLGGGY